MNTHRKNTLAQREPIVTVASVTAAASAIIAAIVAFGVDLSEEQTAAVMGLVAVAAPLLVTISRKYVTPNTYVIERDAGGEIVAGQGHEVLDDGETVRAYGDVYIEPRDPELTPDPETV